MAKLANGTYTQPTPEQRTGSYKRRVRQEMSALRTRCAETLEQSDREHEEAARDYHQLRCE